MPRISIMTMAFGGLHAQGLDDIDMLARLEAMGYDGVEIPASRLLEDPARRSQYHDYFANHRLQVSCIDAISDLAIPGPESHAQAIATLRQSIDLAAELACPLVLSAGSQRSEGEPPEADRARIAAGLNACLPAARERGVALAIEDFGVAPTLQCAAADCLAVLKNAPGTVFAFDTGNFYFAGEDPLGNLPVLAPYIRHAHFKDWVKSNTPEIADVSGTALGTGFLPNPELARRLTALGTAGCFSIELGGAPDVFAGAVRDLETLRTWIRTIA